MRVLSGEGNWMRSQSSCGCSRGDPTGNRRWWPVRCTSIDLDGLREVRDQLWAEAVARFHRGEAWWPATREEKALCEREQSEREAGDAWDDPIRVGLQRLEHTTISEVLTDLLAIPLPQQGRRERLRVAACLRRLGWVEVGKSNDVRRWGRGPSLATAGDASFDKPVLRLVPPLPENRKTKC
jgi:putative DNA primase/helicase